jgi:hypothetical protein
MRPNKLECLYLAITFQSSLTYAGNTRRLPKKEALKDAPIGFALALPSNSKTYWKGFPRANLKLSLSDLVIIDEGKKFYNIDTWAEFTTLDMCVRLHLAPLF